MMLDDVLKLWAKSDRKRPGCYHPLLYHCADAAHVARTLWLDVLSNGLRTVVMADLGIEGDDADGIVALLAGLHDLGKASPAFQRLRPEFAAGFSGTRLALGSGQTKPHGTITARELKSVLLNERFPVRARGAVASVLAKIAGAHHGYVRPGGRHPDACVRQLGRWKLGGRTADSCRRPVGHA